MQNLLSGVSAALALVAIGIAVWQGMLSRSQLNLAKQTRGETESALSQIQRLTEENKRITDALKDDFDSKIGRIFDHWISDTERKAQAAYEDERQGAEKAGQLLSFFGSEFKKAVEENRSQSGSEPLDANTGQDDEPPSPS